MAFKLFNALSGKVDLLQPADQTITSVLSFGPLLCKPETVYKLKHYFDCDLVVTRLTQLGVSVRHVLVGLDVGDPTSDTLITGQPPLDAIEAIAGHENKSVREIIDYYGSRFFADLTKLAIAKPTKYVKCSEYAQAGVGLILSLEKKGLTAHTPEGIVLDLPKAQAAEALIATSGSNVLYTYTREQPFYLWRFEVKDPKRYRVWESYWGKGYPSSELLCAAAALTGWTTPADFCFVSQDASPIFSSINLLVRLATGTDIARCVLLPLPVAVASSTQDDITMQDVATKSIEATALRYLFMTTHYRQPFKFSFSGLRHAETALKRLYETLGSYEVDSTGAGDEKILSAFCSALDDDLNLPQALGILWEMLKSNMPESEKVATVRDLDTFLALNLANYVTLAVPLEIEDLLKTYFEYKKYNIFDKAAVVKRRIEDRGYSLSVLEHAKHPKSILS